ncbi:hypothetical protein E2320_018029, partial [Naja naja]
MRRLLAQARERVQHCSQKHQEMARELEAALKAKDAANLVRESVQAGAAIKIQMLELGAEAQQRLWSLLQEAKGLQVCQKLEKTTVELVEALGRVNELVETNMRLDQGERPRDGHQPCTRLKAGARIVARARHGCAQGREVAKALLLGAFDQRWWRPKPTRWGAGQDLAFLSTGGRGLPTKGGQELDFCPLPTDLQAVLEKVAASEEQLEQREVEQLGLTQQLEEKAVAIQKLQDEVTRLAREKERAQQERDNAQRDFREALDCREVGWPLSRGAGRGGTEEGETWAAMGLTLGCPFYTPPPQFLEQENEVARRQLSETEEELKATLATLRERGTQLEDLKDARQKLQQEQESLRAELGGARSELQDTQAGLEGLSRAVEELGGLHAQFLEAADILQMARTGEDLRLAMEQLHLLAKDCHTHIGELQAQSLQLEQQLQTSQTQHQAEMDAAQAAQMKLRKVLHLKIQSEKELQELLRQQEEKQCQLSDQKREVVTLREEVAQLKLELQKSETAATTLWEEMSGSQRPDAQEKIWLRQEVLRVGKLRELLLQKDTEHTKALTSHVKQ